jgi:hypothetical protein
MHPSRHSFIRDLWYLKRSRGCQKITHVPEQAWGEEFFSIALFWDNNSQTGWSALPHVLDFSVLFLLALRVVIPFCHLAQREMMLKIVYKLFISRLPPRETVRRAQSLTF